MTNGDRIRSMSDEELTEFLRRIELGDIDYSVTFCNMCKDGGNALGLDCGGCLLHWLQTECIQKLRFRGNVHGMSIL